jgi:hypothetical protein
VTDTLLASILGTGFAVAFLHAALPTHWLPFVLVGRAQGWSRGRTLAVAGLAGLAHVAFTIVLGLGVVTLGIEIHRRFAEVLPALAAGVLLLLGGFYVLRTLAGAPAHAHAGAAPPPGRGRRFASDGAAMGSLVLMLTLSPCEAFLPVYLSGAAYGWGAFTLLSAALLLATAAGMLLFTLLALLGAERLRLGLLERYDSLILGVMLCLLAVAILVLQ